MARKSRPLSSSAPDRMESQLQGAAVCDPKFVQKWTLLQRACIESRPKRLPRGRKPVFRTHSRCHIDAKALVDVHLKGTIECDKPEIKADRPDQVFRAFEQGIEIGFSLAAHGVCHVSKNCCKYEKGFRMCASSCFSHCQGPVTSWMQVSPHAV